MEPRSPRPLGSLEVRNGTRARRVPSRPPREACESREICIVCNWRLLIQLPPKAIVFRTEKAAPGVGLLRHGPANGQEVRLVHSWFPCEAREAREVRIVCSWRRISNSFQRLSWCKSLEPRSPRPLGPWKWVSARHGPANGTRARLVHSQLPREACDAREIRFVCN